MRYPEWEGGYCLPVLLAIDDRGPGGRVGIMGRGEWVRGSGVEASGTIGGCTVCVGGTGARMVTALPESITR